MTNQIEPELFKSHLARLKTLLAEEGRDPNKFKSVLYYGVSVNRDRDEAFRQAKTFLDAYYQKDFTRPGVEIWTACGPVDHCAARIKEFLDLGVDHVAIRPIGDNLEEQFRIYLEELLPALAA